MTDHDHRFDRADWEQHWTDARGGAAVPPNPAVERETAELRPGTALDAGCGTGAESRLLATRGWAVTGVDVSAAALAQAAEADPSRSVDWVRADLTTWSPAAPFDLVVTSYAHAEIPQLDLYERLAGWVAPGGTLLIVGHGHGSGAEHGDASPTSASVTAPDVADRLRTAGWRIETVEARSRTVAGPHGHDVALRDVVVRATRP